MLQLLGKNKSMRAKLTGTIYILKMYKLDKQCIQPNGEGQWKKAPSSQKIQHLWPIRLEVAPFLAMNFVPKYTPKKLKLSTHFDSVQKALSRNRGSHSSQPLWFKPLRDIS